MSSSPDSLSTWDPTPAQSHAADLLARGYSQSEVSRMLNAAVCNVSLRTVQRWWAKPEFQALIHEHEAEVRETYNRRFARLVNKALEIEEESLDKDSGIFDDERRADRAHEILSKTAYRVAARRVDDRIPVRGTPPREIDYQD